ncbi:MAG: SDR family oxidoreductase [Chloroflexota bacterium]
MTEMQGRVVVVTGAGGGIGSAVCRGFAALGASVVLVYRSSKAATEELMVSLPAEGDQQHIMVQANVDNSAEMEKLAQTVAVTYGRVDVLVNNAGFTQFVAHDDLTGLDDDLIDRIFQVNFRGAFAGVRVFKEQLMQAAADGDPALVINMSSIAGTTGEGSNVAYCASKAAMDSMTRSLARALSPHIRVLSIAPGLVDGEYAKNLDAAWYDAQVQTTPLKRLALAEDVAAACVAAATQLKFTTGNIIHVDGGRPLA